MISSRKRYSAASFIGLFVLVISMIGGCASMEIQEIQPIPGRQVFVNQEGYHPILPKIAVSSAGGSSFEIIDLRHNNSVYSGELSERIADPMSGKMVQQADFSSFMEPGRYILLVDGRYASLPFDINENIFHAPLLKTLRSYSLQRASTTIRDPLTGLSINAGHLNDREAIIYFSDDVVNAGDRIDVHGGWYDAGDFGRYIPPAAVTTAQLLLTYDNNRDAFYKGQMAFPPGFESPDEEMPDFLKEIRFNLEWMRRMQRADGAVFHKTSGRAWPGMIVPEDDRQDRYVYGLSTFGTAQFAGTMAMAARIYRRYNLNYSDQLLAAAEAAIQWLMANPEPFFRFDENQDSGSGPYGKHSDAEERFWAAAEMLRTTGNRIYSDYIVSELSHLYEENNLDFVSWANSIAFGYWAYATAPNGADSSVQERIQQHFISKADEILEVIANDGFRISLTEDEYTWASAKNAVAKGNLLLMAYTFEPKNDYLHGALDQLNYVMGRSPTGYSYITGVGSIYPQHPHHRIMEATGITVPGLLVGGPNIFGGDPTLDQLLRDQDVAPGMAYIDTLNSWATNEYAIDYTAPAVYALAFFNFFDYARYRPTTAEGDEDEGEEEEILLIQPGDYVADYSQLEELWDTFTDGSSVIGIEVASDPEGNPALRIDYELFEHGWLGATLTSNQDWTSVEGVRFMVRAEAGQNYRFEFSNYDRGLHQILYSPETSDWHELVIPFSDLRVRGDYQHPGVRPDPDFSRDPVRGFTISPLSHATGRVEMGPISAY
ncbi:glycoside hydrolase family 9 protein [Spirochaeta dissipatitropha]